MGNPSGTKIGPHLDQVVARIVKHNPSAVIILDSVYMSKIIVEVFSFFFSLNGIIGTLRRADAANVVRGLWSLPASVLDRVVFLESLSKVRDEERKLKR